MASENQVTQQPSTIESIDVELDRVRNEILAAQETFGETFPGFVRPVDRRAQQISNLQRLQAQENVLREKRRQRLEDDGRAQTQANDAFTRRIGLIAALSALITALASIGTYLVSRQTYQGSLVCTEPTAKITQLQSIPAVLTPSPPEPPFPSLIAPAPEAGPSPSRPELSPATKPTPSQQQETPQ